VLIYLAEDGEATIKERLLALCRHRSLDLQSLPLYVITAPRLRLDLDTDRYRLDNTAAAVRPILLVLDPLVRLHARNENNAGEISALRAYLRELQRSHYAAVLLVHHTRKNPSGPGGQNLRGSSDLHAWSDSSLYLSQRHKRLTLTPEHRSAPSPEPLSLALLCGDGPIGDPHLAIVHDTAPDGVEHPLEQKLFALLRSSAMSRAQLRSTLQLRNERLGHLLDRLAAKGLIVYKNQLWQVPFPSHT
jgi:hypothetical protein